MSCFIPVLTGCPKLAVAGGGGSLSLGYQTGLVLWLEADHQTYQDTGFVTAADDDGEVVGGWQDRSSESDHLTQSTTAKKPLLKTSVVNGHPVLRSDGVDDWLSNLGGFTSLRNASEYTYLVVFQQTPSNANLFDAGPNAGDRIIHSPNWTDGNAYFYPTGSSATGRVANSDANWQIQRWVYDGSGATNAQKLTHHKNGVSQTLTYGGTIATSVTGNISNAFVGVRYLQNQYFFNGDLAALLIYDHVLSAENLTAVESDYLNIKYAVY